MANAMPILPAHVEETVRAIAKLHLEHHRQATTVQRIVDRSVATVAKPRFVGWLTFAIVAWIAANIVLGWWHHAFDGPPFALLQDVGTALALYITVLILITQRRENEIGEYREQLTLELAILAEQKSSKIIQLLEDLRRDNPTIDDRDDQEAAALAIPADPQAVLDAIKDRQAAMIEADH